MKKKNGDKFYVTKYGSRYAVRYPDGLIRCIVKSESFAEEICKDHNRDARSEKAGKTMRSRQQLSSRSVICTTTGEEFPSVKEAARKTGLCVKTIVRDCNHLISAPTKPRPRFEWGMA